MRRVLSTMLACVVMVGLAQAVAAQPTSQPVSSPVETTHPGLASGVLSYASLADLPQGVLLDSEALRITAAELDAALAAMATEIGEQSSDAGFFVLEQMATRPLVLRAARQYVSDSNLDLGDKSDAAILGAYQRKMMEGVKVTDAEVAAFYEANKDMCGGSPLDQIKDGLRQFVTQQKQQEAVREHVRTLGQRTPIRVSAKWAAQQSALAKNNAVDQARASGRPSMIDFGADGCRPCDMMTPILESLRTKYADKANVLFVHVRKKPVVGARYGVVSIPTQVFFDKTGREVFRHTGFYPQADVEKQLKTMGVE